MLTVMASCKISAAQDLFSGNWECSSGRALQSVRARLQIGNPERNVVYPARLTLDVADRSYVLQFLMVRREARLLNIGSLKFWENGKGTLRLPFSENWSGELQYSKDLQGNSTLTLQRIPFVDSRKKLDRFNHYPEYLQSDINWLADFFNQQAFPFIKKNDSTWNDENSARLIQPKATPQYVGMADTLFAPSRYGRISFEKNKDLDLFSVLLNDRLVVDRVDSKKSRDPEEIVLDTGLNIITLLADDFGNKPGTNAGIDVYFDDLKRHISFKDSGQKGNTMIVQKIYVRHRPEDETSFEELVERDPRFKTPTPTRYLHGNDIPPIMTREEKIVGRLLSRSAQLTFAIWDDAVEDGDSISLRINDRWITQGFPVRKKPQFITVNLEPGPNYITFIADNLGSIVPNTSVLEIIDGNRRKSFHIETDLDQNNQVRIYYELR